MKKLLTASLMVLAIAGAATSAEAFSLTKLFSSAKEHAQKFADKAGPALDAAHKFASNPENQKKMGDALSKGLSTLSSASKKVSGAKE